MSAIGVGPYGRLSIVETPGPDAGQTQASFNRPKCLPLLEALNSQSREVLSAADAVLYGLAYSGTPYLTGYGAPPRKLR